MGRICLLVEKLIVNISVLYNEVELWEGYVFLLKGVMPMRSAQPGVLNKRRIHHPVNNVT